MENNDAVIKEMKQRVFEANLLLPSSGLVMLTWGNVSEINREFGVVAIKPSGVPYDRMRAEDMVLTDLKGKKLEKDSLNPSSDLATHLVLYEKFETIQSIVHTHSSHAVMWAQAGREIPAYGTTHADTFYGNVPLTRHLTKEEVDRAYEEETGNVIVETFMGNNIDVEAVPGVVVNGHGPFTWGNNPNKAVENSMILEEVARMALYTELINPKIRPIPNYLLDKHYLRKHGKDAYYGQG